MLHQVALWQEQYPDDNFDFIPATTATDDEIETIIGTKGDSRTKDYDDEVVLPTMHVKSVDTSFFFCRNNRRR